MSHLYSTPARRFTLKVIRPEQEQPRPAPDPSCPYCSGRGWVVGGDEVRDCYCRMTRRLKSAWEMTPTQPHDGGLLPTDLTADNSAKRGRRDALRHEAGE